MAGKRKGRGSRGNYKFTYKRKAALARAQKISARKRRGDSPLKKAGKIAGIAATGAAIAYLGYRNRGTINSVIAGKRGSGQGAALHAVQPGTKENVRVNNSVSGGHPSRTTITETDRLRAQNTRDKLTRQGLPPHMGGRDPRWYDSEGNINTEAMTNSGVSRQMRAHRKKAAEGNSTTSYTGTPGGTKTPPAAKISKARAAHNGFTEDQWQAITGFEDSPRQPTTSHSTGKVSKNRTSVAGKTTSSASVTSTPFSSAQSQANYSNAYANAQANAAASKPSTGAKVSKNLGPTFSHASPAPATTPTNSGFTGTQRTSMNDAKRAHKEGKNVEAMRIGNWNNFQGMNRIQAEDYWEDRGYKLSASGILWKIQG